MSRFSEHVREIGSAELLIEREVPFGGGGEEGVSCRLRSRMREGRTVSVAGGSAQNGLSPVNTDRSWTTDEVSATKATRVPARPALKGCQRSGANRCAAHLDRRAGSDRRRFSEVIPARFSRLTGHTTDHDRESSARY